MATQHPQNPGPASIRYRSKPGPKPKGPRDAHTLRTPTPLTRVLKDTYADSGVKDYNEFLCRCLILADSALKEAWVESGVEDYNEFVRTYLEGFKPTNAVLPGPAFEQLKIGA